MSLDVHQKAIEKLMRENSHRHRPHEVFRDFCELSALALSNAMDLAQREPREKRYMEVIKRYEKKEADRFGHMMAELVQSMELGMKDVLGELFMAMDMGSHWHGQFFTPYHLSKLMAQMIVGDAKAQLDTKEFITVMDPACGAGCMVIAAAEALKEQEVNYQQKMHVTAIDVDPTAVHMAYIQFSLYHIPAVIVHGNTLSLQEWGHWFTPAHILGLWHYKRKRRRREEAEFGGPELLNEATPALAEPEKPKETGGPGPQTELKKIIGQQMDFNL